MAGIDIAAGVINRDYQGELRVLLHNSGTTDFNVKSGDWIAQLVIERIAMVDIEKVDTIDTTNCRDKDFGLSGV